ncbi:MAG: hypothetical protein QNJ23_01380 [Woeseiaceae bacterium]|nr:hypothetical protein [Woeseiaceae bacterium]
MANFVSGIKQIGPSYPIKPAHPVRKEKKPEQRKQKREEPPKDDGDNDDQTTHIDEHA